MMNLNELTEKLCEGIKMTPYAHQKEILKFAANRPDLMLLWSMGCVHKDTEITLCLGRNSRRMRIEDAYYKYHASVIKSTASTRSFIGSRIGKNNIQNIVFSGRKIVAEVILECGKRLKTTLDHEYLTINGYVRLDKLAIGDLIMVDLGRKPKRGAYTEPLNYKYRHVSNHPYGRARSVVRHDRGGSIQEFQIVAEHRLIIEAHRLGLRLEQYIQALKAGLVSKTSSCYLTDNDIVHHINHKHKDNRLENLMVTTREDHQKIHNTNMYTNFKQGIISYSKVTSITILGEEDTYDIVCHDPYRNFVANGMVVHNSGKSGGATMIARLRYAQEGRMLKTLIVSPPVTLVNWGRELQLFSKIPSSMVHILQGSGVRRANTVQSIADSSNPAIIITNYESLLSEAVFRALYAWQPELVIGDESHYIKNPKAKRAKLFTHICDKAKYKLLMSGTAILKDCRDVYGQFRALDKGQTFGTSLTAFTRKYMSDSNAAWSHSQKHFPKMEVTPNALVEISNLMYKKADRRTLAECVDLPPLIKKVQEVEMSAEQRRAYTQMEKEFVAWVKARPEDEAESVTATLGVVKALRLLQMCTGYVPIDAEGQAESLMHEFVENPRLDALEEILEELEDEKIIIWCSFKQNYRMIEKLLKKLKRKYVMLTGEQNTAQKNVSIDAFQNDPTVTAILCNRAAGGIGINLTAAAYSVVYSRNFNLGEELQSEARNYRGGSQIHEKIVKIDLVCKNSIDELVVQALTDKNNIAETIMKRYKNGN